MVLNYLVNLTKLMYRCEELIDEGEDCFQGRQLLSNDA